ncbi:MAG: anhydro-N-acetylmuramic acid kinase [Alphaproteobacteria bacterium]|nr:anhydro-N-acetylmuramic acid kinase [Alphaproteobacteria bacterium]
MTLNKVYRSIGLMSGTSLDGVIDVALIETDGRGFVKPLRYYAHPYDIAVRDKVRACFGKRERDAAIDEAEKLVTDLHIEAVKAFDEKADLIGFHGQTITHDPDNRFTWQLGDGQALAKATGIDVIYDMRKKDVLSGGQGAPLLPLYHQALFADHEKPVAILNLGGVANMTYVGEGEEVIASDCGPANALMDDFIRKRTGKEFDEDGRLASRGNILNNAVDEFLSNDFFKKPPPKSLDRDHWSIKMVEYASDEDGMASLMEMTVQGVLKYLEHLPQKPAKIYTAGGGAKNSYLVNTLQERTFIPFEKIDVLGWNGDAIEAEGFAYLAVRSKEGLHLTLPTTTGSKEPTGGGLLAAA